MAKNLILGLIQDHFAQIDVFCWSFEFFIVDLLFL